MFSSEDESLSCADGDGDVCVDRLTRLEGLALPTGLVMFSSEDERLIAGPTVNGAISFCFVKFSV